MADRIQIAADTLPIVQGAPQLLAWFDRVKRPLPWRATGDPYAVWISEVMLQQTRVETVIPYYLRFLARFPDVAALATAEEPEVLALWSGLGYYRRCRNLLQAARRMAAGGGSFPESARELELLPGIGPYTAAAVASIAFAEPVPVLDGNVERLLSRYAALAAGGRTKAGRTALLELAATLLDPARPGDSNQALMELGATVCTPRGPRCAECPLAAGCKALASGDAERFPVRDRRAAPLRVREIVAFVEREGRLLLFRRSRTAGQLAGLWECPGVQVGEAEVRPEALLAERFGGAWSLDRELVRLTHAITTRTFAIEVRRASFAVEAGAVAEGPGAEAGWWSRAEARALPLTGLAKKLLARAEAQPG